MSELFKISDADTEPSDSVVFVHGLGGHHYDTWRCGPPDTAWNADPTFWPLWLANDIQSLAVFTIGYETPVLQYRGTAMHFTDQAENILAVLLAEPALARGNLVFIGHSLGGLLIKQLLRSADVNALQDARAANLIERGAQDRNAGKEVDRRALIVVRIAHLLRL